MTPLKKDFVNSVCVPERALLEVASLIYVVGYLNVQKLWLLLVSLMKWRVEWNVSE